MDSPLALSPHLLARLDQDQAAVDDLLHTARQHLAGDCAHPAVCGADDIGHVMRMVRPDITRRILAAAIIRLAQTETATIHKGDST